MNITSRTGISKSISNMSKTFKDSNRDYKEVLKPAVSSKRKLTYEEKQELKRIREDMHYDRLMKQGFS